MPDRLAEDEERIVSAAKTGRLVDLRVGDPGHWAPKTVRAEVLVELLTSGDARVVRIRGACFSGRVDLEFRTLTCAVTLRDCRFEEPLELSEATASSIRLYGCRLPGIEARQLRATGNLQIEGGEVTGEVYLSGVHIGGFLSFERVRLVNARGFALNAESVTVEKNMFCRDGFTAEGGVELSGARIGDQLSFHGARLSGAQALNAERLTVGSEMDCGGLTAVGGVNLTGADIGGALVLIGAKLDNPFGPALRLRSATMAELMLRPRERPNGEVDLTNARTGAFDDDPRTWPSVLRIRGFTYETLENEEVTVHDRLRWPTLHPDGYAPQIYDRLAAVYRAAGRAEAARRIAVAKQWRRRGPYSPANWLLYATIGYGYRTWLAAVWLAALTLLGGVVFANEHRAMHGSADAPAFHAVAYTLDVLIPVIDLGQRRSWTPHGAVLYWSWALTGAGWLLTTAAVAGLSGVFKRD